MKQTLILILLLASLFALGCQEPATNASPKNTSSDTLTGGVIAIPIEEPNKYLSSEEINCYGNGGFDPEETLALKNMPIYFVNQHTRDIVITIKKDNSHLFVTTKLIHPGSKYKVELKEEGNYTYWDSNYAPKGKIVVR